MCDRSYPKKLAFQYLEDLKNEFERVNGNQIETAARPYAFIKFGKTYICIYISQTSYILLNLFLPLCICFSFCISCQRHVHTEDKEIIPGHPHSEKYCKVE